MPSLFRLAVVPVLACGVLAMSGCSTLRTHYHKRPTQALPAVQDSPTARYVHGRVARHVNASGFRLLTNSTDALLSRVSLIDHATRSIDMQYYIFDDDDTGRLVAQRLLAAADRGVRVRLLVDDINVGDNIDMLEGLDADPHIQVRLFNPFSFHNPSLLSKAAQFVLEAHRLNRRMHNKSFVVDGDVAIIGGRNIGDDYFDASRATNFRDLDLIAIGPAVAGAEHTFDAYWNCAAAYPVKAYTGKHAKKYDLAKLRANLAQHSRRFAQSHYAQAALDKLPYGPSSTRRGTWFWGPARVIADQPRKIDTDGDKPSLRIGPDIKLMTDSAKHSIVLISPYFIPGEKGTRYLDSLARKGIDVSVLTNSLASTDEPVVYAGYSRYRKPLLKAGVHLYELRPAPGEPQPATTGGKSSGVSLHAKAIVVDDKYVFIGSMNMDARSRLLNTEMGTIIDCPALADAVTRFFGDATRPAHAFHVVLAPAGTPDAGQMQWRASKDGRPVTFDSDPGATTQRKLEVQVLKLLPIESLL